MNTSLWSAGVDSQGDLSGSGNHESLVMSDVVTLSPGPGSLPETSRRLGRFLCREGINLLNAASHELRRGTPVYVDADADVLEVQRLMAEKHVRMIPVVRRGQFLGLVDLVELALRDER